MLTQQEIQSVINVSLRGVNFLDYLRQSIEQVDALTGKFTEFLETMERSTDEPDNDEVMSEVLAKAKAYAAEENDWMATLMCFLQFAQDFSYESLLSEDDGNFLRGLLPDV